MQMILVGAGGWVYFLNKEKFCINIWQINLNEFSLSGEIGNRNRLGSGFGCQMIKLSFWSRIINRSIANGYRPIYSRSSPFPQSQWPLMINNNIVCSAENMMTLCLTTTNQMENDTFSYLCYDFVGVVGRAEPIIFCVKVKRALWFGWLIHSTRRVCVCQCLVFIYFNFKIK